MRMDIAKHRVISFDLLRIERGREKICKCNSPRLIIDEQNRIVICECCGATLDGFEALMKLANHSEEIREYETVMLEKANTYKKLADKELRRRMKNKVFKDMDKQYQNDMYPYCPKCGEMINPVKIIHWGNKKFYDERKEQE